jgi:hypothetical protein
LSDAREANSFGYFPDLFDARATNNVSTFTLSNGGYIWFLHGEISIKIRTTQKTNLFPDDSRQKLLMGQVISIEGELPQAQSQGERMKK